MKILEHLCADGYTVFETSYVSGEGGEAVMVRIGTETYLAVSGTMEGRFSGTHYEGYTVCPTDHTNRLALNELFPFTRPQALGRQVASFGFGDRLGYANPAQLRALKGTAIRPVLAQQSLRELSLTGRSNTEVLDVASWAVFREGYRGGYASDGDHLKSVEEIAKALGEGCTMITVDCSLVLRSTPACRKAKEVFASLPEELCRTYTQRYLHSAEVAELGLVYTEAELGKLHVIYSDAIDLVRRVFFDLLVPAGRAVDLEVSLDETDEITSPEAHYFVACELESLGVAVNSMAPRFVGEFQKAIDYLGDLVELERAMVVHGKIADRFGYKLSLHSGSEKYSVLPILAKVTNGRYHLKTSGTSWLEVVETIAKHAPELYRRMHRVALEHIDYARKFYVVHCDTSKVRPLAQCADEELPCYLDINSNDSRQLMHITYGSILEIPELKRDILAFLDTHMELYEKEVEELYKRHVDLLQQM